MPKTFIFKALAIVFVIFCLALLKEVTNVQCANSLSCKESLSLKVENGSKAIFGGQTLDAPSVDLAGSDTKTNVLGEETLIGDKRIEVDLTTQTVKAYQGDVLVLDTLISSGKWFETPPGEFKIWHKVRSTRMTGGEGADFYDLPNVQYVMFFYNSEIAKHRGFAFHGAYWHNNFGHAMSHGCVNMRNIDAEKLYKWADEDTKITIYGKAP